MSAKAAQLDDLQVKLSSTDDGVVDLEADLLIMKAGRMKIVAMHAEAIDGLCRVKQ